MCTQEVGNLGNHLRIRSTIVAIHCCTVMQSLMFSHLFFHEADFLSTLCNSVCTMHINSVEFMSEVFVTIRPNSVRGGFSFTFGGGI